MTKEEKNYGAIHRQKRFSSRNRKEYEKKFLKKLFCIHQYKYSSSKKTTRHEADFSGNGYNTWTEVLDVYVCEKCGKTKKVLR